MLFADFSLTSIDFRQVLGLAFTALLVLGMLACIWIYAGRREQEPVQPRSWWTRLAFPTFWILVAVLAVTSFGTISTVGHMSGYALLAHLAAAGAFVFLLVLIAPLAMFYGKSRNETSNRWWVVRWSAGLMVVSALITAGTMFLSMIPILDTSGLLEAAAYHRFAGLAVVLFTTMHVLALLCTRLGIR